VIYLDEDRRKFKRTICCWNNNLITEGSENGFFNIFKVKTIEIIAKFDVITTHTFNNKFVDEITIQLMSVIHFYWRILCENLCFIFNQAKTETKTNERKFSSNKK
jgi:hypothetical protein